MNAFSQSTEAETEKIQLSFRKKYSDQYFHSSLDQSQAQTLSMSSQRSPYLSAYQSFFSEPQFSSLNQRRKRIIEELCQQGNIRYEEDSFAKFLELKLFNATVGYEIVHLQAKIGYFTMPVLIYNAEGQSPTHHMQHMISTFASIYAIPSENQSVVKCFEIKSVDQMKRRIRSAIKQNCFARLAAAMKVGPAISQLFGFDLVVFDNCIQFAMEKCQYGSGISKEKEYELKSKLFDLHSISLVHMDIKTSNISYSPSLQQDVFIDFGLSDFISQSVGSLTLTKFSGSLNYCCPQMLRLYHNGQGLVDLYHNDVYCFQESMKEIRQNKQEYRGLWMFTDELYEIKDIDYQRAISRLLEKLLIIETKCRLYRMDSINCKKYNDCINQNCDIFIKFIRHLPYSFFLQDILSQTIRLPTRQKVQTATTYHYKKYSFQSTSSNEQENLFYYRFEWLKEGNIRVNQQKLTISTQNCRNIVLKFQIARKMPRKTYFEAYVYFVNLQVRVSSFQQKQEASLCMLNILGLMKPQALNSSIKQQKSSISHEQPQTFSLISRCLMAIFNQFVKNPASSSSILLIPTIFHNLVILESISLAQMLQIVKNIISLPINPTSLVKILLRCSLAFDFIQARCSSKYQNREFANQILELLMQKMKEIMKKQNENKLIEVVIWLIENDRKHHTDLPVPSLLLLLQETSSNCKDSFMLELVLYYYSIILSQSISPIKILNLVQALQYFQQSQINNQSRFQYYHFRVAKKVSKIGNWEMVKAINKRLDNCLQHPYLTSKYCLHYLSKYSVACCQQKTALHFSEVLSDKSIETLIYQGQVLQGLQDALQTSPLLPKMQQIKSILHKKVSLELLLNINFPDHSYSKDILGFYKNYYYAVFIFYQISKEKQNIYQQMNQLLKNMAYHLSNISCVNCKSECQVFITLMEGFLLQAEGQIEKALHVYWQNDPEKGTLKNQSSLLLKTMRLGSLYKDLQQKYDIFNRVYSQMAKQQQVYLLIQKGGYHAFQAACSHFVIKGDINGLVNMHLLLCEFLFNSFSLQHIVNYAQNTALFFSRHYISTFEVCEKYSESFNRHGFQFSALFLSSLLRNQDKYVFQDLNAKTILIICKLTLKLPAFARSLVLNNLYSSLLHNINQKIEIKTRLKRFWFIQLSKIYQGSINKNIFMSEVGFKKRKGLKHTHLCSSIIKYIQNISDKVHKEF